MIPNNLADTIRKAGHCILLTHMQPDGDALGSLFALGSALTEQSIRCSVIAPGPVPDELSFLSVPVDVTREVPEKADLCIVLDCAEKARIAPDPSIMDRAARSICIDHHRSNEGFCDINWIDPDAASTCEMVAALLDVLDFSPNREQSAWLYTGMVTDTGRFLYSSTSGQTLRRAADLIETGIDRDEIHRALFQSMPYADFLLYRQTLARALFLKDRDIAISWITAEDFASSQASPDGTDPALNALRDIEDVELSCLLKEHEPGIFKVSLRSKRRVDVSAIAASLGGGGHLRAAGCTVRGSLESAREQLVAAIDAHWNLS